MTQPLEDFLINAATGGGKWKRQAETDTAVIREQANCLVVTNGIEPINKHELISRTIEIQLDLARYGVKPFHETQVIAKIKKDRGYILSGLLRGLSAEAIPRMNSNEVQRIANEFGGHAKDRFDEYFGLMSIIVDFIWKYHPAPGMTSSRKMVADWLKTQTASSDSQDEGTNDVLYFLSELMDRRGELIDTKTKVDKTPEGLLRFKGTMRTLLSDFRLLARKLGMRCPWESERHLSSRFMDAEQLLKKQGWIWKRALVGGKWTDELSIKV